jgi:hypothetical protein
MNFVKHLAQIKFSFNQKKKTLKIQYKNSKIYNNNKIKKIQSLKQFNQINKIKKIKKIKI